MVTYSDMMSLLLTFFIMLFSASEVQFRKFYEVQRGFQRHFRVRKQREGEFSRPRDPEDAAGSSKPGAAAALEGDLGSRPPDPEAVDQTGPYASRVDEDLHELTPASLPVRFEPGRAALREQELPVLLRIAERLRGSELDVKVTGHASSMPLGPAADAGDHLDLAFRRALSVSRFLSGEDGGLARAARAAGIDPAGIEIGIDRITVASRGSHSPEPYREKIWENPELDDRVEVVFLPPSSRIPEGP
jgi:chemotaxis protein MotB